MLVEYQPIRAWVDGKEDDKALLQNAEQVFVLNPTGNKVESLRSEIMRLRGKNEELGMRIQYETQRGHIGLLRHKLAAATKEQADAAAAAQRIKQLEAELMASRADRAKLAAMNQKLEAALAALRATLEQRNNSARSEAALLAEMRQREQQLTLTLRTYQEQAVVSSATLQEANSLRAELERFKGIAQQATSTLSRQVTENERLAGLLDAESARGASLAADNRRLQSRVEELESRLAARSTDGDGWRKESESLEARLRDADATSAGLRRDKEGAEERFRELERRLRDAEARLASREDANGDAMRDLEKRLREAEGAARTLQVERQQLEARLREVEGANERERDGWRRERAALEERARTSEQRLATLQGERTDLERRLHEALSKVSGLESRISILVSEKEQLAWEFDDLVTLTFKQIDGDGSGALDGPEIRRALNLLGLTQVSDQQLIARHDGSKDAKIQLEEFPDLVREMLAQLRATGLGAPRLRPTAPPPSPPSPPPPQAAEEEHVTQWDHSEEEEEEEADSKPGHKPHWRSRWLRGNKH